MNANPWVLPVVLGLLGTGAAYGFDHLPHRALAAEPAPFAQSPSAPSSLVFGEGNVTTATLTLYVFKLDDGHLLASNAPANATARYTLDGDFQRLPALTLHLGNGTAPAGSFRLPASFAQFEAPIAQNLTGHRVGHIVEVNVTHYPWLDLFGPLRVVARIDALLPSVPPVGAARGS